MAKFTVHPPQGQPITVEAPSQEAAMDQVLDLSGGPDVSSLGSFGRGAAGMIPLGEQAYAGVAGLAEHKPYLQERQELNQEIGADKEQNPGARLAGQAAGVVAPIVATAGLAAPETLLGAAGQGALFGGAYGAGNAIDTLASGGSGTQAAGDVALGAGVGAAGGAGGSLVGKFLGGLGRKAAMTGARESAETAEPILAKATSEAAKPELSTAGLSGKAQMPPEAIPPVSTPPAVEAPPAGQAKQGFFPSMDELKAETLAGVLGGSPRQIRAMPGKDLVKTMNHMGDVIKEHAGSAEPLIVPGDRYSDRLDRFSGWQSQNGKTIGDIIDRANVPPVNTQPLIESLQESAKFAGLDESARLQKVIDRIKAYSEKDKTPSSLGFGRLHQLKGEIGDEAFNGQGSRVLQNAYHVISDMQDDFLEKGVTAADKTAFAKAKEAYQVASRAVPMLRMATARSLAKGYSSYGTPLAALVTGHPVDALSHLLKEPLSRAANAVAFSSPDIGAKIGSVPALAGARVATKLEGMVPTDVHLQHPAMAPWREMFQKNAAKAKDQGEISKANAVTDFTLSQRDPAYAKAKQTASEAPQAPDEPKKMAEGGIVSQNEDKPFLSQLQDKGYGTLSGLEKVAHDKANPPIPMEPTTPVRTAAPKDEMHQPFNSQFEDQLKAYLTKSRNKSDAK